MRACILTICVLIFATPPAVGQGQPRCIASRDVVLAFGEADGVSRVEAWVTADDGQRWTPVDAAHVSNGALRYTAESDGRLGFYLVLENDAGRSAAPPEPGDSPHISVIVDTAPPTIQVRRWSVRSGADAALIDLRLTLIEENLGAGGLRLFYRTAAGEAWSDGGTLTVPQRPDNAAEALVSWPVPPNSADKLDLLLVGTDRAGNSAREELLGVRSTVRHAATPARLPTSQPTVATPAPSTQRNVREANSNSTGDLSRAEQMRTLASRFLAEGRMDLAAARFSDALAEAPNDPQLLTEYGAALVRSNRLDDARQRFESALAAAPKNTAALEGLALVALGQQRLPDARDSLRRALEIDGGAGRVWLRYGDVEYRMGNQTAAFDAWKKAGAATGDAQLQATVRERLKSLQR